MLTIVPSAVLSSTNFSIAPEGYAFGIAFACGLTG